MTKFIPTLWSAKIKEKNKAKFVFAQPAIINRDYEGEITGAGDTVKIGSIGDITVKDYVRGALGNPEEVDATEQTLLIDQEKAFNFAVEDIDAAQSNIDLVNKATERASDKLTEVADNFIAGLYPSATTQRGTDAAPKQLTKENVFGEVVDLATDLDTLKVPREGRFLIVDPTFYGLLIKSETLQKADLGKVIANGEVGQVAGFTVYLSNNNPKVAAGTGVEANTKVIGGHPSAWTFAEQIVKVKGYEPEGSFSQAVKGLHVYGGKVVDADGLAVLSYKL